MWGSSVLIGQSCHTTPAEAMPRLSPPRLRRGVPVCRCLEHWNRAIENRPRLRLNAHRGCAVFVLAEVFEIEPRPTVIDGGFGPREQLVVSGGNSLETERPVGGFRGSVQRPLVSARGIRHENDRDILSGGRT